MNSTMLVGIFLIFIGVANLILGCQQQIRKEIMDYQISLLNEKTQLMLDVAKEVLGQEEK